MMDGSRAKAEVVVWLLINLGAPTALNVVGGVSAHRRVCSIGVRIDGGKRADLSHGRFGKSRARPYPALEPESMCYIVYVDCSAACSNCCTVVMYTSTWR